MPSNARVIPVNTNEPPLSIEQVLFLSRAKPEIPTLISLVFVLAWGPFGLVLLIARPPTTHDTSCFVSTASGWTQMSESSSVVVQLMVWKLLIRVPDKLVANFVDVPFCYL